MDRASALSLMPATDGRATTNYRLGRNEDIRATIHNNFARAVELTRGIASRFRGSSDEETVHNVFHWFLNHIRYQRDPQNVQWVRLPNRLIADGKGDCKSFALATMAILKNLGFDVQFRYTGYRPGTIPTHVYGLAKKKAVRGLWTWCTSILTPKNHTCLNSITA